MRLRMLGCVLVLLLAAPAGARRLTPGVAFTATLQSDTTSGTATMTWRTHRNCAQFGLLTFRCDGGWDCEGPACPGRRGFLAFVVQRSRYDQAILVDGRRTTCLAEMGPSSYPPPQQPPFHWRYRCVAAQTGAVTDSGTVLVELKPAP